MKSLCCMAFGGAGAIVGIWADGLRGGLIGTMVFTAIISLITFPMEKP